MTDRPATEPRPCPVCQTMTTLEMNDDGVWEYIPVPAEAAQGAAPLRCVRCGITMQAGEERKCSRSNFSLWCSEGAAPRAEGHHNRDGCNPYDEAHIAGKAGAAPRAEGLPEVKRDEIQLKADMAKFEEELKALKAALSKTGTKSIFAGKKKQPEPIEYSLAKGGPSLKGAPHGRILHKQIGYGLSHAMVCDRYLVVTPELWIAVDENNQPQDWAANIDIYGQLHWENNCPNRKAQP